MMPNTPTIMPEICAYDGDKVVKKFVCVLTICFLSPVISTFEHLIPWLNKLTGILKAETLIL
jgi:hypothetical protein